MSISSKEKVRNTLTGNGADLRGQVRATPYFSYPYFSYLPSLIDEGYILSDGSVALRECSSLCVSIYVLWVCGLRGVCMQVTICDAVTYTESF